MTNVTGEYRATPPTLTDRQQQNLLLDSAGALVISGSATISSGSVTPVPPSSGSTTSVSRIVSAAASTNATSAKASAGTIMQIIGYNAAAALRYLKIYDKASAPTVGTDTPILTIPLPAAAGFVIDFAFGFRLNTGIAYALTTGAADADTGALTAADVLGLNVVYA